jgi:hypothetical protein
VILSLTRMSADAVEDPGPRISRLLLATSSVPGAELKRGEPARYSVVRVQNAKYIRCQRRRVSHPLSIEFHSTLSLVQNGVPSAPRCINGN